MGFGRFKLKNFVEGKKNRRSHNSMKCLICSSTGGVRAVPDWKKSGRVRWGGHVWTSSWHKEEIQNQNLQRKFPGPCVGWRAVCFPQGNVEIKQSAFLWPLILCVSLMLPHMSRWSFLLWLHSGSLCVRKTESLLGTEFSRFLPLDLVNMKSLILK